jgi:cysteine desulfurase/selenocysteine lyase
MNLSHGVLSSAIKEFARNQESTTEDARECFAMQNGASLPSHLAPLKPVVLDHLGLSYGDKVVDGYRVDSSNHGADARVFSVGSDSFSVGQIREHFPILKRIINGKQLIWLDNAATTQRPLEVVNTISEYYLRSNSNIHRGAHSLAFESTQLFEDARDKVTKFIGASSSREIIFTRGATEALNLAANILSRSVIRPGDEVLVSTLEHHSNIVPWQLLQKEFDFRLIPIPVHDNGDVDLFACKQLIGPRTKVVAITHASNAIGTIPPIERISEMAHRYGALVVLDAAQSIPHGVVDVGQLGCDMLAFSAHKIYGPMGAGVLYITSSLADRLQPWQGGGNMIRDVSFMGSSFQSSPARFEAGTPPVADVVGMGAAIDFLTGFGVERLARHEELLLHHLMDGLRRLGKVSIIGSPEKRIALVSFVVDGFDNSFIGKFFDDHGIAVRVGHHCAQPILRRLGTETSVRPSLGIYNTIEEVDEFLSVLRHLISSV